MKTLKENVRNGGHMCDTVNNSSVCASRKFPYFTKYFVNSNINCFYRWRTK